MGHSGFSFLGLMIFVALIAVAGSFVMITITPSVSNAGLEVTVKKMDAVIAAINKYKTDSATGANPPTLAYLFSDVGGVGCSVNTTSSKMQGWCGPYLTSEFTANTNDAITDGWGTAFEYDNTGNLYSWGPNKTDNGGGSDDLTRTF